MQVLANGVKGSSVQGILSGCVDLASKRQLLSRPLGVSLKLIHRFCGLAARHARRMECEVERLCKYESSVIDSRVNTMQMHYSNRERTKRKTRPTLPDPISRQPAAVCG